MFEKHGGKGGTPHIPFEGIWSNVQTKVGTPHQIGDARLRSRVGGRLSNKILNPTLALIRAQLGFRIQVRADCGNIVPLHKQVNIILYIIKGISRQNLTRGSSSRDSTSSEYHSPSKSCSPTLSKYESPISKMVIVKGFTIK